MAEIRRSPRVRDYIVEIDWATVGTDGGPTCRDIVAHFEAGDFILLNNVPLRVDYDLLNRITVPALDGARKLSYKAFLYPKLWQSHHRRLLYRTFGLNLADYWRFRNQVRRLNAQVHGLTRQIFPTYRFVKEQFSWRFLPTDLGVHPLHIDAYGSNDDIQYVRFFVNLDREPRVWKISHRLEEVAEQVYRREGWSRHAGATANEFCRVAGRYCLDLAEPDCHEVSFAQGDVWLCDTRKISHGVVSGHRMMATHFWADPQGMHDPSKRIDQVVQNIHARYADGDVKAAAV